MFICDECIGICSDILDEEFEAEDEQAVEGLDINLLKPKEIKEFLDDYVIGRMKLRKFYQWLFIIIIREYYQQRMWM